MLRNLLPRLSHQVVIGIQANHPEQGAKFISEYEAWAAKYWPDEWRRPFVIAYLGEDGDRVANRFLSNHEDVEFDCVIKVGEETSSKSATEVALHFFDKLLTLGLDKADFAKRNKEEEQEAQQALVDIFSRYGINYLNNKGALPTPNTHGPLPQPVLGLFGGMGPLASAACLQQTIAELNSLSAGVFYWSNPAKPQNESDMGLYRLDDFGLWKFFRALHNFLSIVDKHGKLWIAPSNTFNGADVPKFAFVEGLARVQRKLLNMIDVVTEYVYSDYASETVAMLGTSKLKKSDAYNAAFANRGDKKLLQTTEDMQKRVQEAINQIKANDIPAAQEIFREVIQDFINQGAKVIVLGCTEIHLAVRGIMPEFINQGITFVDTSEVIAKAGARFLRDPQLMMDYQERVSDEVAFLNKLEFILKNTGFWHSKVNLNATGFNQKLPSGVTKMRNVLNKNQSIEEKIAALKTIQEKSKGGDLLTGIVKHTKRSKEMAYLYQCIEHLTSTPPNWDKVNEIFKVLQHVIDEYNAKDQVPSRWNRLSRVQSINHVR